MTAYDPSVMTSTMITTAAVVTPSPPPPAHPSSRIAGTDDAEAEASGARLALISGAQLRRLRKRVGWTQRELAERVGYSQSQVACWEADRYRIPTAVAAHLRDTLMQAHQERANYQSLLSGIERWPTIGEW